MQISEQFRLAAKDWCEKDAAANILEETKSAVLSERMAALGDMPVSKAEMTVKASQEWREFIESMVTARKEANLAKVRCEWIRMRFQEWSSQQANDRAERRL
jgi:ribosomal protein L17